MLKLKYLVPVDKKKTESEILLEAQINMGVEMVGLVQYERILKTVSEWYAIDWMNLFGICKKSELAKAQRICMFLLHKFGGLGYEEIAEIMRQKESINVVRKIDKVITELQRDEELRNEVFGIVNRLK